MPRSETATFVLVWAALMALLAATLGVSFLHWGTWNGVLNLGIAVAKTALILWFYMHLRRTRPLVRLAGATAPLWLAILFGLALSDYVTR
ncbi:cytochrome C oxidase subunit IV family protein [Azospirillum sp.]|uniref:cytochrome C oxidase subunit IV family protein n=1 Tax=Azospirillum sp. TaxID=34012 RepID=UPI003D74BFA7